jgi:hypothetical protein
MRAPFDNILGGAEASYILCWVTSIVHVTVLPQTEP